MYAMRYTIPMILTLPLLLWIIFFATLFFIVFLGAILGYHWLRYAMNPVASSTAIAIYAGISGILLVLLFGATALYPILG